MSAENFAQSAKRLSLSQNSRWYFTIFLFIYFFFFFHENMADISCELSDM